MVIAVKPFILADATTSAHSRHPIFIRFGVKNNILYNSGSYQYITENKAQMSDCDVNTLT
jgi:hypothetical protein